MRRSLSCIIGAQLWLAVSSVVAFAADPLASGYQVKSPYMRVYGVTPPPYGHVDFCRRSPEECQPGDDRGERLPGNREQLAELGRVNRQVNAEITPMTDMEQYGVEDYWTVPASGKGDCEDYALLKRQRLMGVGWPASALLMTVVFDEKNEGHAILMARTVHGDMILDNKNDDLKFWYEAPYHYVMRESFVDPRVWMTLDPDTATPTIAVAGNRKPPGVDEVPACRPRSGWCAVTVKNP